MLGQLGSSADNSKSTCKPLSDNKDSFSDLSIRVLKISLYLNVTRGDACYPAGVPSLVRIPKSDYPQRLPHLAVSVDNYSLLGSRLCRGDNNNLKANLSFVSNNNSKSVILLSSTSYGDYYFLLDNNKSLTTESSLLVDMNTFDELESMKSLSGNRSLVSDLARIHQWLIDNKIIPATSSQPTAENVSELKIDLDNTTLEKRSFPAYAQNFAAHSASSSITLIVSKNEITDHALQSFLESFTRVREPSTSPFGHVTVTELAQRICVPLLIECKRYDNDLGNNDYYCNNINDSVRCMGEEMNIRNNNPDVIQDIVNVAVCYKTSSIMTTNARMLGSQNDGISCTEATIFTVGALSFQDNDKSNKPLNDSFKNDKYQVSTKIGHESNSTVKSVSKSTLSDKSSNKSDMSRTRRDKSDDKERIRSAVNIPILTICEPTMTLKCQSATVTSQTIAVPVSQRENCSNDDDDDIRSEPWVHGINPKHEMITENYLIFNDSKLAKTSNQDDRAAAQQFLSLHDQDCIALEALINAHDKETLSVKLESPRLIAYIRTLIPAYQKAYKFDKDKCEIERQRLKNALNTLFSRPIRTYNKILEPILDYKRRWGIPSILRLIGGGESSLNTSGAANWGTTQATTPNNNNATQSGWGGTPGNPPGNAGPPSNWGGNNVNRSVTGNPNQNQNQGPPGAQSNQGNVNKVNNPNQPPNTQPGPPTSQPNNPVQGGNPNNGQWPQGKPNNPVGPGPNPTAQNNNSNNVPQQPSTTANANNNQIVNPAQGPVAPTTPTTTSPSTKQQLEQLNTMREALFSQDGWGAVSI